MGPSYPLGALLCGETYQVDYVSGSRTWRVTGLNESLSSNIERAKRIMTQTNSGPEPEERKFSMWGIIYSFDDNRRVYDPGGKHVGRMRFVQ